jgi:hypothetical protein
VKTNGGGKKVPLSGILLFSETDARRLTSETFYWSSSRNGSARRIFCYSASGVTFPVQPEVSLFFNVIHFKSASERKSVDSFFRPFGLRKAETARPIIDGLGTMGFHQHTSSQRPCRLSNKPHVKTRFSSSLSSSYDCLFYFVAIETSRLVALFFR